jgi:hypothetical protein
LTTRPKRRCSEASGPGCGPLASRITVRI